MFENIEVAMFLIGLLSYVLGVLTVLGYYKIKQLIKAWQKEKETTK
jgi:hypothetical protein